MYVTLVYIHVVPGCEEAFLAATLANHRASVQEAGNCRFDVLQQADDPSRFVLYEAYESREAAAAHKDTDHYRTWREAVADMMAEPRRGVVHEGLAP